MVCMSMKFAKKHFDMLVHSVFFFFPVWKDNLKYYSLKRSENETLPFFDPVRIVLGQTNPKSSLCFILAVISPNVILSD